MIEIKGRDQFKNAAERITKEKLNVRRFEPSAYTVVNVTKMSGAYIVRFYKRDEKIFGACDCEAGKPTKGAARVPRECKHLLAAILTHNAVNAMRRAAAVAPEVVGEWNDDDDPDCDINNWTWQ
jgi:hypothetical protein